MSESAIILTLDTAQANEVRPLLKAAYLTSGTVFAELRRGPGADVQLVLAVLSADRSRLVQQLINSPMPMRLTSPKPKAS